MSNGFTDQMRDGRGPLHLPGPGQEDGREPTFADLVDLYRNPLDLLSGGEHWHLRNHIRSILGLPIVVGDEEVDAEVVDE